MLLLLLAILLCTFVHMIGMLIPILINGVYIEEAALGIGPKIFIFGKFAINLVPLGGYVKMANDTNDLPPDSNLKIYDELPALAKLFIALSGPTALLLFGFLILGFSQWHLFTETAKQILLALWGPLSHAQEYLNQAAELGYESGLVFLLGYVALKIAALNLIPIPLFNGGAALFIIIESLSGKKFERLIEILNYIGLVVSLIIAFALIRYFVFFWI